MDANERTKVCGAIESLCDALDGVAARLPLLGLLEIKGKIAAARLLSQQLRTEAAAEGEAQS